MMSEVAADRVGAVAPATGAPSQEELRAEADRLYETYVKPHEQEHWGEYVAVAPDGATVFASSHREALRQATETLAPGNFIFKVGQRAVGTLP